MLREGGKTEKTDYRLDAGKGLTQERFREPWKHSKRYLYSAEQKLSLLMTMMVKVSFNYLIAV